MTRTRAAPLAGLLAVAALALVAWPPTGGAQEGVPILGVTANVVITLDVTTFMDNTSRYPGGGIPTNPTDIVSQTSTFNAAICGHAIVRESPTTFHFNETRDTSTDCGEVGLRFQPPEGVVRFTLEFLANRSMTPVGTATGTTPPSTSRRALQELRVFDDAKKSVLTVPVFPSDALDQPYRAFSFPIAMPVGSAFVNLTWYFEDRGAEASSSSSVTVSSYNFFAEVKDPKIQIPDYPAQFGSVLDRSAVTDGNDSVTTTLYSVVPPTVGGGTASDIHIVIASGTNFTGIRTPDRVFIPAAELQRSTTRTGTDVLLPASLVAQHGTGTYGVAFVTRAPLPPPPPPAPPATIYPVIFALLALPVVPGALASRAGFVYNREARGAYVRTARLVLASTAAFLGLWIVIGVAALGLDQLALMATLPLEPSGWILDGALVVTAIALAALWIVPGRYALTAMRDDLAERRKQALELERSNKELEHFAYIASHDLQEPLRTISGFAQLLERRYGDQLDDKGRSYIARQVAGTQRMQALINDLLAYSRVQTQGKPFTVFDLDASVDAMLIDLESFIGERGAVVTHDALPRVKGDESQLVQVFSNLVRNAIKYRHPERSPVVHVGVMRDEAAKAWRFSVQDNGKGIAPEHFQRIFMIFQRLEARDDAAEQGTGLGLAITQKIVERHHGRIWVESEVGRGSTFFFTLPFEPGESR